MNNKKLLLVGILVVIGGGAAFVYFDPLGLDLLGWNKPPPVVQHVIQQRVAAPADQPPVAAPKAAVAPDQVIAPVSASLAAPAKNTPPLVPLPAATPVVATPVQEPQPSMKLSKSIKTTMAKPERSKSVDLRYCLKLETNEAIAKCAGE